MTTFADTNFLISLLDQTHVHHSWSIIQFATRKAIGPILICDIVYCEFSVGMASQAAVDTAIGQLALERIDQNDAALFRAGQAYKQYKNNKEKERTN